MLLTADGPIQELDCQEMTLRLVDGGFGPALVSGQVKLREVKGSGETLSADAKLSLKARGKVGGYAVKSTNIDVSGPLNLTPDRATRPMARWPHPGVGLFLYITDSPGPRTPHANQCQTAADNLLPGEQSAGLKLELCQVQDARSAKFRGYEHAIYLGVRRCICRNHPGRR